MLFNTLISLQLLDDGACKITHEPMRYMKYGELPECNRGTGERIRNEMLTIAGQEIKAVVLNCSNCGAVFRVTEKVYPDPQSLIKSRV